MAGESEATIVKVLSHYFPDWSPPTPGRQDRETFQDRRPSRVRPGRGAASDVHRGCSGSAEMAFPDERPERVRGMPAGGARGTGSWLNR